MILFLLAGGRAFAQETIANDDFNLRLNSAGITSLKNARDQEDVEFIRDGGTLGHVQVRYRMEEGPWLDFKTESLSDRRTINLAAGEAAPQVLMVYNGSGWYDYDADLELTERFRLDGDALIWTLHFRNVTDKPVEIAEFALPLPFDVRDGGRIVMDSEIAGMESRISWTPAERKGQVLIMTSLDRCPLYEPAQHERNFEKAGLEERGTENGVSVVYLHSAGQSVPGGKSSAGAPPARTRLLLTPKFTPGDEITYAFEFRWTGLSPAASVPYHK
jgi:hypothetical protein